MLMTFLSRVTKSDVRTELKAIFHISLCWPCSLVGKSLVLGASVEMGIKFMISNPDIRIFFF
jgi:hypothetical protein